MASAAAAAAAKAAWLQEQAARDSRLAAIGPGPPVWEAEATSAGANENKYGAGGVGAGGVGAGGVGARAAKAAAGVSTAGAVPAGPNPEMERELPGGPAPMWMAHGMAAKARGTATAKADMATAVEEAHLALQAAMPGILAPPVSRRRAASDPVYAALKGLSVDSGRSEEDDDEFGV